MARERPYYRETIQELFDVFKKRAVNAKEYAEYLGKNPERVRNLIAMGELPGKKIGSDYVIPINAIALFEINNQGDR